MASKAFGVSNINSSGNVGIGTDNPATKLVVASSDSTAADMRFQNSSTGYAANNGMWVGINNNEDGLVYNYHNSPLLFGTNDNERLRIQADGDLYIPGNSSVKDIEYGDGTTAGYFRSNTNVNRSSDGAAIHTQQFRWNNTKVAEINVLTGDDTTNKDNGHITFETASAGTTAERLRITSSGDVLIGTDTNGGGNRLYVVDSHTEAFVNPTDSIVRIENSDTSGTTGQASISFTSKTTGSNADSAIVSQAEDASGNARLEFWTDTSNGMTEKLSIASDGAMRLIHTNSGGVGAYLSIQNKGTATNTRTGIVFGAGNSDAVLDGTDYGEAQIKVYNDSGNYGNMEFNLHTGANRSFMKIIGNGQGQSGAGAGTEGMRGGVAFGCAGIAIDRAWTGQPGIHVFNQNVEGDTDQGTFRFHGWSRTYASYPASSGSDFSVSLVADGMTLTSDRRRKTGITTITDALNTVSQMRGVSYTYVNRDLEPQTHMSMSNGRKLGFIAQEVIPLLPELILDSGEKAVELENGYCDRYNMDYGGVAPLLVEAIKELKAQNESLQARIAALEGS